MPRDNIKKSPSVSVVIPMFNLEGYIENAIAYLKAQTLSDFEVIIIDDGSTDLSLQRANIAIGKDSRFVCIHQSQAGAAAARNHGLQLANGETVIFLDGDDYYVPQLLEKAYKRYRDANVDIVIFQWRVFDLDDDVLLPRWGWTASDVSTEISLKPEKISDYIMQITTPAPWTKLYKRDFLLEKNIRFDESVQVCNDAYFTLLAQMLANSISIIDEVLIYYLQNRNLSITKVFYENNITDGLKTFSNLRTQMKKRDIWHRFEKSFINKIADDTVYRLKKADELARPVLIDAARDLFNSQEYQLLQKDKSYFHNEITYRIIKEICSHKTVHIDSTTDRIKKTLKQLRFKLDINYRYNLRQLDMQNRILKENQMIKSQLETLVRRLEAINYETQYEK